MEHPELSRKESLVDREQTLWTASEQYMRGKITVKKLEEIELLHRQDFKQATIVLAQRIYLRKFVQDTIVFSVIILIAISLITFIITRNQVILLFLSAAITYTIVQKGLFPWEARNNNQDTSEK